MIRWALLATLLAGLACRPQAPATPDLSAIYNRAAQHHDAYRNPVIVIPGILGSRLIDPGSGRTVWGAFRGGAANPQRDDDLALIALPLGEDRPFVDLRDEVEPAGVLDRLEVRLAGLPFQLQAYVQILKTLGAGGYRDEAVDYGDIDYGEDHFTCFQFDYDWRRDNVENAHRLARFIAEKKAFVAEQSQRRFGEVDPDLKFDVIAHSMGGLILRYYLRYGDQPLPADGSLPALDWAGSRHVERAILVGTPNAGSPTAAVQLIEGRKFGPLTPRYDAALLGTFPSIYQLLPRPRHGAIRDATGKSLDTYDAELWREMGWGLVAPQAERIRELLLPDVADPAERLRLAADHQRKSLRRARAFHRALDRAAEPPSGTQLYLFAGDSVPTAAVAQLRPETGRLTTIEQAPGDGTVLRSSALLDERVGNPWRPNVATPIAWRGVHFLFSDHLGVTRDPSFKDNVLYLLLEDPRRQ
ncbi:MAG: hypothetical protein AAF604_20090 [Acidobacteriota bacterium]